MGNAQAKTRGKHKYSKWDNAVPPAPPSKPTIVPGTPKNQPDLVSLRWEPPINDGGAPVTGYLVEHRRTGSPHWVRATPDLVVGTEVTLSGLEPGWRYQFRVSAENCSGLSEPSELSEPLTVTLSRQGALAPHFVLELKDTVALENDKVEFVAVVRGHPAPTISWYKDGNEVFSDRRMRVVTEKDQSMLVIFQASFSDEGEIKCSATNRLGHSVSRARLKIEAAPTIRLSRQYEDGLMFEKDEVMRLKVSVAGRPLPRVTWFHKKRQVAFGGRHEVRNTDKSSSLRVSDARRSDSGEYQVRATNRLGEDVATFMVTVTDRPLPPGKPHVAMILGRSLTLSWTAPQDDGGVRIETYVVEYYRLGWNVWLKAATCRQMTTTLSDLIEGSEYKFRVKADNPYGVSDPSPESDVIFIPDPRRGLLDAPTRSRSITMGDVESRRREEKAMKQTEESRMSKEVNLRTTSAGTLQTERSSVVPKTASKKVPSSEEITSTQQKKANTLPNAVARKNDIVEQNSIKEREIPLKRILDNKPELNIAKTNENAVSKASDEPKPPNTQKTLKEAPKFSSDGIKSVLKTNTIRDAKVKPFSSSPTETKHAVLKSESKTEAEVKKTRVEKEPSETPQFLSPVGTKEEGSYERKPDPPSSSLKPNRNVEQSERKDARHDHFTSPLMPREDDDSIMHGSSELMLVLLPEVREHNRNKGAERTEETKKCVRKDGSPPRLSLSAPALDLKGSLVLPPLRNAVSSSQLLHEKAMARFYEAVAQERRQLPRSPVTIRINSVDVGSDDSLNLARRSSEQGCAADQPLARRTYHEYEADIGRVRSKLAAVGELKRQFAFRQSLSQEESDLGDAELDDEVYDDEEDDEVEQEEQPRREEPEDMEEDEEDLEEEDEEEELEDEEEVEEEEVEEEEEVVAEESEEEEEIEVVPKHQFRNSYESRKLVQQKLSSLSQDDEYEYAEEKTYHPRSMVPIAAVVSRSTESPDDEDELRSIENTTYETNYQKEILPQYTVLADVTASNQPLETERGVESQEEHPGWKNVSQRVDITAAEALEQTGMVVMRPKRAEEPETPGQEVEDIDADVALSAAEIARQRRLKVRQKSVEEDFEASQAIVNHYGDIIREYGSMRKARTVMYLNTEDLKNAAYNSQDLEEAQQSIKLSVTSPGVPEAAEIRSQVENKPEKFPTAPEEEFRSQVATLPDFPTAQEEEAEAELRNQVVKTSLNEVKVRKVEPKKQFGPQPKRKKPGPLAPPAYFPPPPESGEGSKEVRLPQLQRHGPLPVRLDAAYAAPPTAEVANNSLISEEQMRMEAAGRNVKFFVTFLTDLALFAVACWLYFFKDEKLAIPVLIFMVYRQAMDAIKKRLPKNWTRR